MAWACGPRTCPGPGPCAPLLAAARPPRELLSGIPRQLRELGPRGVHAPTPARDVSGSKPRRPRGYGSRPKAPALTCVLVWPGCPARLPPPHSRGSWTGPLGGAASLEQWGPVRRRPSSDLGLAQGAWRRGVRSPHREVPFPARVHLAGSGVRNRVRLTRSLRLCSGRHAKAGRLRRQRPEMQATHGRRLRRVPGGAGRFQATRGKRVTAFIGTTAQGERRGDHGASGIRSEVSR